MISYDSIPSNLRVPGAYIEVDGSQAGLNSGGMPSLLLVGLKSSSFGSAVAGEIVFASSLPDVIAKAGRASMLAEMAARFFAINPMLNLYLLPFSENGSGVQATATLTVSHVASADGVLSLYVAGTLIQVNILSSMTTNDIADAIKAEIDALNTLNAAKNGTSLCATATIVDNVVTLTARQKGEHGNSIDVRLNYAADDKTPAGLVVNISGFSGGTLIPVAITESNIASIFDADDSGFLDSPSKYIALGLNDATTLDAFHVESQRRYMPPIQSGFRAFAAFNGSYSEAITFGSTKNYEHICNVALGNALTTQWEAAAIIAATAAPALYDSPVRSLEGIALKGLKVGSAFTFVEQNALLFKGMSLVQKARDGSCSIKRLISMYLHRPDNSLDDAYLDINTAETMERIRYEQRMRAIQRFTGTSAAVSDEGYRAGLRITTVDSIRAFLLTTYSDLLMRELGWVQNYEYYKANLVIEQDPLNPSRFNYIDTPVILSPFYILAGKAQFRREV